MEKDRFKGAAQKFTVSIKKAVGKLTGNKKVEGGSSSDKSKGADKATVGKAKDAARDAVMEGKK